MRHIQLMHDLFSVDNSRLKSAPHVSLSEMMELKIHNSFTRDSLDTWRLLKLVSHPSVG